MARREDDSYTNGSVFEASVEEGMRDKSEAYAEADVGGQPEEADGGARRSEGRAWSPRGTRRVVGRVPLRGRRRGTEEEEGSEE